MPWVAELEQLLEARPDLLASLVTKLSDLMAEAQSISNGMPPQFADIG
jgi:hypothetical protein